MISNPQHQQNAAKCKCEENNGNCSCSFETDRRMAAYVDCCKLPNGILERFNILLKSNFVKQSLMKTVHVLQCPEGLLYLKVHPQLVMFQKVCFILMFPQLNTQPTHGHGTPLRFGAVGRSLGQCGGWTFTELCQAVGRLCMV